MSLQHSCELLIAVDHPALPGHFPGRPLVPAALLADTIARAVGESIKPGPIRSLQQLRFMAPVLPGLSIQLRWQQRDEQRWRFSAGQEGREVCQGTISTAAEDPELPIEMAMGAELIDAAPFYRQLPHSGSMCLIEQLGSPAEGEIVGRARLSANQPLLHAGYLSGWCGLEYAAQLLACQGARLGGPLTQAQVVMARRLYCRAPPILAADQVLDVRVQVVSSHQGAASCVFTLHGAARLLVNGEFTVIFG